MGQGPPDLPGRPQGNGRPRGVDTLKTALAAVGGNVEGTRESAGERTMLLHTAWELGVDLAAAYRAASVPLTPEDRLCSTSPKAARSDRDEEALRARPDRLPGPQRRLAGRDRRDVPQR